MTLTRWLGMAAMVLGLAFPAAAQNAPDVHPGLVEIQSTAANALDLSGGLEAGTGDQQVISPAGVLDITAFPTGGTWTLASGLILSAGGAFVALAVDQHAIGGAGSSNVGLLVTGTLSTGAARGTQFSQTTTPATAETSWGVRIAPTLTEFSSGVHPTFAALSIAAPIITAGGATVTTMATVEIEEAPTAGVNNYAFLVKAGAVQFEDSLTGNGDWIADGTTIVNDGGSIAGDAIADGTVDSPEIAAGAVGTSELNTDTSSQAVTADVTVTMNDYSFFPNMDYDDCSGGGATNVVHPITNSTDNTVGRFGLALSLTPCESGSIVERWRYVTSSDHPQIWAIANADGTFATVWQSGDPVRPDRWPENPNPLLGSDLLPGQRFVNPDIPGVTRLSTMMAALSSADRAGARNRMRDYVVEKRGWLADAQTEADLANVAPRYQLKAQQEALRGIAAQVEIDPAELILELMTVTPGPEDRLIWKPNVGQVLRDHLATRNVTLEARSEGLMNAHVQDYYVDALDKRGN